MAKVKKLTPNLLRRIIKEEKRKIETTAREVKAKDMAGTLSNKIDYLKVLKIHESKLKAKLRKIMNERKRIKSSIIKDL
jgi:hypothetical protein